MAQKVPIGDISVSVSVLDSRPAETTGSAFDGGPQLKRIWSGHIHGMPLGLPYFLMRRAIADFSVYTLYCRGPKLGDDRTLVTAMQQIADWFKKLGMSEYAPRFVENRIDLGILPDLTDQDLRSCSAIAAKMLRAIPDLSGASVSVTTPSAPVGTEPPQRDDDLLAPVYGWFTKGSIP
jgi:hypothetical protein